MPDQPPEEDSTTPGDQNPWYVLMTVAGTEAAPGDRNFHERNRRYWNGWQSQALSDEEKMRLIAEGRVRSRDLAPLTEDEQAAIARELALRCPDAVLPAPGGTIDLRGCQFEQPIDCTGFAFVGNTDFQDAIFLSSVDFKRATFLGRAIFGQTFFTGRSNFQGVYHSEFAYFGGAKFDVAVFQGSTFAESANFGGTEFKESANFDGASFAGPAIFQRALFSGVTIFRDATFEARTFFNAARFLPTASPPQFFNATLHEDTDFTDVRWPDPPATRQEAIQHRRSYERLKLLMDSQKKTHDEHMFHRMEMRCREIEEPRSLVTRASELFRVLSDYGWSIGRPAAGLMAMLAIGWALIFMVEWADYSLGHWPEADPEYLGFWQSGALSLSSIFGFLGLGRTFLSDEIATLTAFSEVVSAIQTIVGLVLFFLLGLGLRNRFRMR